MQDRIFLDDSRPMPDFVSLPVMFERTLRQLEPHRDASLVRLIETAPHNRRANPASELRQ